MNEPRRLSQSGGVAQRLLDSASIDRPSVAARRRAEIFAGTASSFSHTAADSGVRPIRGGSVAKTLVTWAFIGAAASVALAFAASRLLEGGSGASAASAAASAAPMAELLPVPAAPPARPSEIRPEPDAAVHIAATPAQPVKPLGTIVPWVPSPAETAAPPGPELVAVGTPQPTHPSSASFDEVREIQAAREAVSRGDNSGAIATLNQYDQTHPSGVLKAESTVLRVQALSNSGKTTEAKQLANDFAGKNPTHPLTQQLKSVGK